jgi:hypothetical protein
MPLMKRLWKIFESLDAAELPPAAIDGSLFRGAGMGRLGGRLRRGGMRATKSARRLRRSSLRSGLRSVEGRWARNERRSANRLGHPHPGRSLGGLWPGAKPPKYPPKLRREVWRPARTIPRHAIDPALIARMREIAKRAIDEARPTIKAMLAMARVA